MLKTTTTTTTTIPSTRTTATTLKWILHANFVVPTRNPYHQGDGNTYKEEISTETILWIGPGLKILLNHVMTIDTNGFIHTIEPYDIFWNWYNDNKSDNNSSTIITPSTKTIHYNLRTDFICPGFIDLHIHAPQYLFTGTGTDRPLMGTNGWLEAYTFPTERSMYEQPRNVVQDVYKTVVQTTLRNGTTTAVYFSTLHKQPCEILIDSCIENKQRAFIGKVCMDRHSPTNYCQTLDENINESIHVIEYIYQKVGKRQQERKESTNIVSTAVADSETQQQQQQQQDVFHKQPLPLILPMLVPRFIPTCSPALLSALGKLAMEHNILKHTSVIFQVRRVALKNPTFPIRTSHELCRIRKGCEKENDFDCWQK